MSSLIDKKDNGNWIADPGKVFVCLACGKTSHDRYGIVGEHSTGWDESCMLNCEEFKIEGLTYSPGGRVVAVGS